MKYTIITNRKYEHRSWFDLVREWEDDFKQKLEAEFIFEPFLFKNRYWQLLPFFFTSIVKHADFPSLYMEMKANVFHLWKGNPKIVPWIIDWYVNPRWLLLYKMMYKRHRIVLISSAEVFQYLKRTSPELKISHLALSLSDKYKIDKNTVYEKKYDVVLLGRQNPVLNFFLEQYQQTHRDIIIYIPEKNEVNTRDGYMKMIRMSKIGLYATPGIDGGKVRTHGFSQVTPRFLEFIAGGCHIIARYEKNEDTDYYELEKFSSNIDSYENFERVMDKARTEPVDMESYAKYLSKHYTSERVKQLKKIIENE